LVSRLNGGNRTHENGNDNNDPQGTYTDLRTLMNKFFPVHFSIFRAGYHTANHQQVLANISENCHSCNILEAGERDKVERNWKFNSQ
jgi:hypothetical protein